MAEGALARSRANIALAVTGFADAGDEPGLVHFACARAGPYDGASRGAFRPDRPRRHADRVHAGGGRDDDGDAVMAKAKRGRRSARSTATASSGSRRRPRSPRPATSPSTSTRRSLLAQRGARARRRPRRLSRAQPLLLRGRRPPSCRTPSSTRSSAGSRGCARESAELAPVLVVGAPLRRNGRLYNCGARHRARPHPRRRPQDLPAQLSRIL